MSILKQVEVESKCYSDLLLGFFENFTFSNYGCNSVENEVMIYFSEFILFGNYSKVMLILVTVQFFSLKVLC